MGKIFAFLLVSITIGVFLYIVDIFITEEFFSSFSEYDEHSILYTVFYYNNSESGYNSMPTKFHIATIVFFSFYAGVFAYHKTPSAPRKEELL